VTWVLLVGAIVLEVGATSSLKPASSGRPRWYLAVACGYLGAFALFSLALHRGLQLGVGYGIWSALGVALTALVSRVFFGDPLNRVMLAGIGLIIVGVLLVELSVPH